LTALLRDLKNHHKTRQETLLKSAESFKAVNNSLNKIHSKIESKIKSLETGVSSHVKNSKRELETLQGKSKELNDAIVNVKSGSGRPKHDPCLLKIVLDKALEIAEGKQAEREKGLQDMRVECAEFEKRMIVSLKDVLGGLVKGTSASMKALGEALASTLASIDADDEGRMFMESQKNVVREEPPFPAFDYGLDDPLARVVKRTDMKKQKAIAKSSFTNCYALLVCSDCLTMFSRVLVFSMSLTTLTRSESLLLRKRTTFVMRS
jgi:hypothetical protein